MSSSKRACTEQVAAIALYALPFRAFVSNTDRKKRSAFKNFTEAYDVFVPIITCSRFSNTGEWISAATSETEFADIKDIWVDYMRQFGEANNLSDHVPTSSEIAMIPLEKALEHIAEESGVSSAVKAYFEKVPLNDILA